MAFVVCRYNNRTYRIDDIDFQANPTNTFQMRNGTVISFIEYHQRVMTAASFLTVATFLFFLVASIEYDNDPVLMTYLAIMTTGWSRHGWTGWLPTIDQKYGLVMSAKEAVCLGHKGELSLKTLAFGFFFVWIWTKGFQIQGALPLSPTRNSAPRPRWVLRSHTPVIGSCCCLLAMVPSPWQILCPPLVMPAQMATGLISDAWVLAQIWQLADVTGYNCYESIVSLVVG